MAGFSELKRSLQLLGCDAGRIVGYPLSALIPQPCTDAEALGLVGFAKESGWASLYVVAPVIHLPRVFVSMVSAAKRLNVKLKMYAHRPEGQDWNEKVFFSQSAPKARRIDQVPVELEKMREYFEKRDHLSPGDVLRYFDWRDHSKDDREARPSIHPRDLFIPPPPVAN